jgi:hypothetical protein
MLNDVGRRRRRSACREQRSPEKVSSGGFLRNRLQLPSRDSTYKIHPSSPVARADLDDAATISRLVGLSAEREGCNRAHNERINELAPVACGSARLSPSWGGRGSPGFGLVASQGPWWVMC